MQSLVAEMLDALANATVTVVEKPWGMEYMIDADAFILKFIRVDAGHKTSLQYHDVKEEVSFIVSNVADEEWVTESGYIERQFSDARQRTYGRDIPIRIRPGDIHRAHGPLTMIEVTSPENDDVIRIEDTYGR